jgi:hypothetical protein
VNKHPGGNGLRARDENLAKGVLSARTRRKSQRAVRKFEGQSPVKKFWFTRLGFVLAAAPWLLYCQLFRPEWLIPSLVWMSWFTWLSAELPTGGKDGK